MNQHNYTTKEVKHVDLSADLPLSHLQHSTLLLQLETEKNEDYLAEYRIDESVSKSPQELLPKGVTSHEQRNF